MNYYFVIRKDDTIYTVKSERYLIKEHLNDPNAKQIVRIGFFEYWRLRLFHNHKRIRRANNEL
jgi:hypothetical protein